MPLIQSLLKQELIKILDKNSPTFIGFPSNQQQSAENWAQAILIYTQSIIPASTTGQQAKLAFKSALMAMNPSSPNGNMVFKSAFSQFAVILGSGMLGWVSVPPPSPIVLDSVFPIGLNGGSGMDCANALSLIIDSWFRTGVSTNTSGVTVNWN